MPHERGNEEVPEVCLCLLEAEGDREDGGRPYAGRASTTLEGRRKERKVMYIELKNVRIRKAPLHIVQ